MVRNNIPCIHVHFYQFLPLKIINVCFISVIIFKKRTFLSCLRLVISHSRLRTIEDDKRVSLYPFRFQCRMCFARGSKVATLPAARHHAYSKVAARKADILFSNAPFVLLMVYPAGCRRHSCPRRVTSTLPFPSPFAYPAVLCCAAAVAAPFRLRSRLRRGKFTSRREKRVE